MKYYSGQQEKNEKEIWLCEVCSTIVFYSNYLKKRKGKAANKYDYHNCSEGTN